jgi:hypothetical protein
MDTSATSEISRHAQKINADIALWFTIPKGKMVNVPISSEASPFIADTQIRDQNEQTVGTMETEIRQPNR